mmetsp:Transcript_16183/g.48818  ORF Transcript_16183/g.48818 Transcript_16183/m.48818 type:complete len:208 (-) Transcript_16183:38-661(-)
MARHGCHERVGDGPHALLLLRFEHTRSRPAALHGHLSEEEQVVLPCEEGARVLEHLDVGVRVDAPVAVHHEEAGRVHPLYGLVVAVVGGKEPGVVLLHQVPVVLVEPELVLPVRQVALPGGPVGREAWRQRRALVGHVHDPWDPHGSVASGARGLRRRGGADIPARRVGPPLPRVQGGPQSGDDAQREQHGDCRECGRERHPISEGG